jgi:uncharacterized membrane protein YfcA
MSIVEILGLGAAAAAAGAINAVAGGGTILTFPALLACGVLPKIANATSTLALVIGNIGSVYGYRGQMDRVRPWLARFIPVSIAGAVLGSWLLTVTTEKAFARLVPFLILFATVLFFLQGAFRKIAARGMEEGQREGNASHAHVGAIVFQFLVAVYGGYFGAGIGILMLASLGMLGIGDLHEMNAVKNVLGFLINVVAALYFVWAGLVDWPAAGVMAAASVAGGYAGAHYSQKVPQKFVRHLVTGIGLLLTVVMFVKEFAKH